MRERTEIVEVAGRRFVLHASGPTRRGRFEVRISERAAGGGLDEVFHQPIVGVTPDEARDRAIEVLRYVAGVDRLRRLAEAAAAAAAPGAGVTVVERAAGVRVELEGGWRLRQPLAIAPGELSEASDDELLRRVFEHFERHAARV